MTESRVYKIEGTSRARAPLTAAFDGRRRALRVEGAAVWQGDFQNLGRPMRRREFVTLLGGATVAWPLPLSAQQAAMPVIGFLHFASPGSFANHVAAFRPRLSETSYVQRQKLTFEYRSDQHTETSLQ